MTERSITAPNGIPILIALIVAMLAGGAGIAYGAVVKAPAIIIAAGLFIGVMGFLAAGLFMVAPNESKVLQLFGRYVGTVHEQACAGRTRST